MFSSPSSSHSPSQGDWLNLSKFRHTHARLAALLDFHELQGPVSQINCGNQALEAVKSFLGRPQDIKKAVYLREIVRISMDMHLAPGEEQGQLMKPLHNFINSSLTGSFVSSCSSGPFLAPILLEYVALSATSKVDFLESISAGILRPILAKAPQSLREGLQLAGLKVTEQEFMDRVKVFEAHYQRLVGYGQSIDKNDVGSDYRSTGTKPRTILQSTIHSNIKKCLMVH